MADQIPDDDGFEGFAIPLPKGLSDLLSGASRQHERDHMEVESMQQRVYNFLDNLSAEDLMTLRTMLSLDPKSPICNYFEGMVVTLLRVVHRVDPATGQSEDEILARSAPPKKS